LVVDLFDLAGASWLVAFILGGTHLESLSHLSFVLAGLAALAGGDLGAVGSAGDLQLGFEALSHELFAGVGIVILLGFRTTLFGHESFSLAGIFALYFGACLIWSGEPVVELL
jgi:hypothetical protein